MIVANNLIQDKKIEISFRSACNFPSTTHSIFGLFRYPAKFIPQVVLFVLQQHASKNDIVFDPFAGYGTVGLASTITGNSYELWDLNPMVELIHNVVTTYNRDVLFNQLWIKQILKKLMDKKDSFIPEWSNINYWFPEEILDFLGYVWYNAHDIDTPEKSIILLALLKTTRYFSYSDEKVYKLYKSKKSKEKIKTLLNSDWKKKFWSILEKEITDIVNRIIQYRTLKPAKVEHNIKPGVDVITQQLDREVDILITSPPYLQAQEYIRSVKLELYWLGYTEEYIRELSRKEIPYRQDIPDIDIYSDTYERIKEKIECDNLINLYEKYFKSITYVLTNLSHKVKKKMFIFVGPVHVGEIKVPIDDIITEHLVNIGWIHETTYIDKVKSRAMFNTKDNINPASKRKNTRMETEHLIVLSKNY